MLKIPHRRMEILYRSIQNYSSIEDNTFLKERRILGPIVLVYLIIFIVSVAPLLLLLCPCSPHFVIIVPHRSPLFFFLCTYIIIVMSATIILWPLGLLYIERRFFHLSHPRIFHVCNVKEVFPLKRIIFKSLIYLFLCFLS